MDLCLSLWTCAGSVPDSPWLQPALVRSGRHSGRGAGALSAQHQQIRLAPVRDGNQPAPDDPECRQSSSWNLQTAAAPQDSVRLNVSTSCRTLGKSGGTLEDERHRGRARIHIARFRTQITEAAVFKDLFVGAQSSVLIMKWPYYVSSCLLITVCLFLNSCNTKVYCSCTNLNSEVCSKRDSGVIGLNVEWILFGFVPSEHLSLLEHRTLGSTLYKYAQCWPLLHKLSVSCLTRYLYPHIAASFTLKYNPQMLILVFLVNPMSTFHF